MEQLGPCLFGLELVSTSGVITSIFQIAITECVCRGWQYRLSFRYASTDMLLSFLSCWLFLICNYRPGSKLHSYICTEMRYSEGLFSKYSDVASHMS